MPERCNFSPLQAATHLMIIATNKVAVRKSLCLKGPINTRIINYGWVMNEPIPVAVRPKAYACSLLIGRIAISNLAEYTNFRSLFVVCCVGSGLCDGLITFSEEFYRLIVSVYDLETSTKKQQQKQQGSLRKNWGLVTLYKYMWIDVINIAIISS